MASSRRKKFSSGWISLFGGVFLILVGIANGRSIFGGAPEYSDYFMDGLGLLLVAFGAVLIIAERRLQKRG